MSAPKRRTREPEAKFLFSINGIELSGEKRRGAWSFVCPAYPALAVKWEGATDTLGITDELLSRAIAPAVKVRAAFFEIGKGGAT